MQPFIALCIPWSTDPAALAQPALLSVCRAVCCALCCNFCTRIIAFWQLLSHFFLFCSVAVFSKPGFFPSCTYRVCCCISSPLKTGEKSPPSDICSLFCAGPGSKRLGIDGDREAIPLTLQIAYSKVSARDLRKDKCGRKPVKCYPNVSQLGLTETDTENVLKES